MAHNYTSIHRVTKYAEYSRIVIQKSPISEFIYVSEVTIKLAQFIATDGAYLLLIKRCSVWG